MTITYAQKLQIVEYLANPLHWQVRDAVAWAEDIQRKNRWNSNTESGVTISRSKNRPLVIVQCNSSVVMLERHGDTSDKNSPLMISDEMNHKIAIEAGENTVSDGVEAEKATSLHDLSNEKSPKIDVDWEGISARIYFPEKGGKIIFFHDTGMQFTINASAPHRKKALESGRFFHAISLAEISGCEDMKQWELINTVKLLIAHDLRLQASIRAVNVSDFNFINGSFKSKCEDLDDEDRAKARVTLEEKNLTLQKAWSDSAEFEGFTVDIGKNFAMDMTENGPVLATTFENRDCILNNCTMLRNVVTADWRTLNSHRAVNIGGISGLGPQDLIHLMHMGSSTLDHQGNPWNYVIFSGNNLDDLKASFLNIFTENFSLGPQEFSVFKFEKEFCILAMRSHALKKSELGVRDTMDLMAAIGNGFTPEADIEKFVKEKLQWADLRFIAPQEAKAGRTFADYMRLKEQCDREPLMAALWKEQGIHPRAPEHTELVI